MANILVTTASDTDADGLTLREALAQADLDAAANTITFAAGAGAITLTQGQLSVASDVAVDGGAGVTIDANEAQPDTGILDLNRGRGDKIDLRTIDANEGALGNQPFQFVGTAAPSGPGQLHVEAFDERLPGQRQCR